MKKYFVFFLLATFAFSTNTYAQFGIQKKIKQKFEQKGKEVGKKKANEAKEKADEAKEKAKEKGEQKGMEEAEKGLDKARTAAEPGLKKAEEYEKKGEEYTLFGLQKAQAWSEDYQQGVASKNPADYKKYGFESAYVKYDVTGPFMGTKEVYIDNGGYKVAEYKTAKKTKEGQIMIGADMISLDYENQSALKMHNPMAYLLANPNQDWEETAEKILSSVGFEKKGQGKILNKECTLWAHGTHRIWVWKGLVLKSKAGNQEEIAIDLKVGENVPETAFEIPANFEVETHGANELFPNFSELENEEGDLSDEEMQQLLDEVEKMSYAEYKAKVLEEEPNAEDEKIRQSYLMLRQMAKRRHDK